jgi:hypothetical protein
MSRMSLRFFFLRRRTLAIPPLVIRFIPDHEEVLRGLDQHVSRIRARGSFELPASHRRHRAADGDGCSTNAPSPRTMRLPLITTILPVTRPGHDDVSVQDRNVTE